MYAWWRSLAMESSNSEMNTTTSQHETNEITNLKAHPPPAVGKIALHPAGRKRNLSPSSSINSSPDSPLDDPFNSDDDDYNSVSSTESSSHPHKHDRIPVFENSVPDPQQPSDIDHHAKSPITPNPSPPVNNNSPTTEAPCNQAMERAASTYRIPSSVFARSKSGAPMDWSVASNESLFSIHTGNMSFRNDNLFWRSGELGAPAGEASTSDHMFSYSAQQPKCAEIMRSRELGLAEATMKEVIRESESQNCVTSLAAASRSSHGSGTSNKSFAFSIKAEDSHKGVSSRIPSSVRSIPEEQAQCQPAEPAQPSSDPKTTSNSAHPNWPCCFSCSSLW